MNLTSLSLKTKITAAFSVILLILVILIWFLFQIFGVKAAINPVFGKLPKAAITPYAKIAKDFQISENFDTNVIRSIKTATVFEKTDSAEENLEKITKKLFSGIESKINTLDESYWLTSDRELFYDPVREELRYGLPNSKIAREKVGISLSEEELKQAALKFLYEAGFYKENTSLKLEITGFLVASGMEFRSVRDLLSADFVDISVYPIIGNTEFLINNSFLAQTSVGLRIDGLIAGVVHRFINTSRQGIYPLKKINQVKKELNLATPVFVKVLGEDIFGFTESIVLKSVSFNKISLAYYTESTGKGIIAPVYKLEGQAYLDNGKRAEATFLLPAVAQEWLQQ